MSEAGKAMAAEEGPLSNQLHERLDSKIEQFLLSGLNKKGDDPRTQRQLSGIKILLEKLLASWDTQRHYFFSTERLTMFLEVGKKVLRYAWGHPVVYVYVETVENLADVERGVLKMDSDDMKADIAAIMSVLAEDLQHLLSADHTIGNRVRNFVFAAKAIAAFVRLSGELPSDLDRCIHILQRGLHHLALPEAGSQLEESKGQPFPVDALKLKDICSVLILLCLLAPPADILATKMNGIEVLTYVETILELALSTPVHTESPAQATTQSAVGEDDRGFVKQALTLVDTIIRQDNVPKNIMCKICTVQRIVSLLKVGEADVCFWSGSGLWRSVTEEMIKEGKATFLDVGVEDDMAGEARQQTLWKRLTEPLQRMKEILESQSTSSSYDAVNRAKDLDALLLLASEEPFTVVHTP